MGSSTLLTVRAATMQPVQGISSFFICLLFASSISSTQTGYGHKPAPCTTQLVSLPSHTCKVEYDKTCIVRRKAVEHVSGYAKGECKQVVKEKCYRRVHVPHSRAHGHYHKRSADPSGYDDPEICDVTKKVVCEQVPIIEEVVKDVEICESAPREVCRNTEVFVPKVTCEEVLH